VDVADDGSDYREAESPLFVAARDTGALDVSGVVQTAVAVAAMTAGTAATGRQTSSAPPGVRRIRPATTEEILASVRTAVS
jgi:hypothetical protein